MPGYAVDVDELAALQEDLQRCHKLAAEKLQEVQQIVEQVKGAWKGYGSSAYEERQRSWAQSLTDMNDALEDMRAWIETAEGAYREAMQKNLRMATG